MMNERIKELAEQAGIDLYGDTGVEATQANLQELAELIVRECSKVNNQYVGWRIGDIDLDMVYKEHFGVE
jgi:hypothetical protein